MTIHIINIMNAMSTPQAFLVLNIASTILEGFKHTYPVAYMAKVCIDIPKEVIKYRLICS